MKKKILQILILTGIAFLGVQKAQAMITCDEAADGEACSLMPIEELEQIEIDNQRAGESGRVTLGPSSDTSAPGVILIHQVTLTRAPTQAETYSESPWAHYRSPLSKAGL